MCEASLPSLVNVHVVAKTLPPILNMQLANACSDNKNRYALCFFSLLVANEIFCEVYINFMLFGHTHDNIDTFFGRWRKMLKRNDYPTLPLLMKSFMDVETQSVIPHVIKEHPDFKGFTDACISKNY
jgi:hypothetical protein